MLMWTSVAASGFGDRIVQMVAWELTGISLAGSEPAQITAAITFFFMLPYVLFGTLGGWIADTLPRKWVRVACDEIRAGLVDELRLHHGVQDREHPRSLSCVGSLGPQARRHRPKCTHRF